ncbi:glycosyltransferase family 2 protein [Winogradskyella forsetii]|uniref:glycosyltransferase family 2 protein n=1 Tax=Winogradskyella forsetii TaxID=2686077 RepID=UPI0015B79232|nr:glycosyltransferase family 2 protein [Winogradskyella forsetii]
MPEQPLVSIIIPTFNRVHLIEETLNSILTQTYQNWECIVVDDGSSDGSEALLNGYIAKDNRFVFFHRPQTKAKGANACRNIGLEKAQGDYIIFFDSDDLMTKNHLEVKINAIQNHKCDYVITKTEFFNSKSKKLKDYYKFEQYKITPYNYIAQNVNWLTLDVCIIRELTDTIKFNENLQSGQEFNYFSKLTHITTNAVYIDKVVSLRRKHANSIRGSINSQHKLLSGAFLSKWHTYLDLKEIANHETRVLLIKKCLFYMAKGRTINYVPNKNSFIKAIFKELKFKALYFFPFWLSLSLSSKKGYYFYNQLVN